MSSIYKVMLFYTLLRFSFTKVALKRYSILRGGEGGELRSIKSMKNWSKTMQYGLLLDHFYCNIHLFSRLLIKKCFDLYPYPTTSLLLCQNQYWHTQRVPISLFHYKFHVLLRFLIKKCVQILSSLIHQFPIFKKFQKKSWSLDS